MNNKMNKILVIIGISIFFVMVAVGAAYNSQLIHPSQLYLNPSIEFIDEDYCHEWCDLEELYSLGCDQLILAHLTKYSNLLDEEFAGMFFIEWVSLPEGVSVEKFDECVDFISEKRIISLYKDMPEVVSFYAEYEDAQVSLRDDHISYFSGSADGYLIRMNLEFDGNYEIHNKELHCYFKKVHHNEFPQEDIVSRLAMYDCGKIKEIKNEN